MFDAPRPARMFATIFLLVILALTNTHVVSTETKTARTKTNVFDPVLSANAYTGRLKENERTVQVEPRLSASDADPSNSINGKICGYEVSLHKHDDTVKDVTGNIPFAVELIDGQPVLKLKSNINALDCEVQQTYRLFVRAFDCAASTKRRYSERSSLTITVDDVNEYAPVFTHDNYLFKLHEDQTCDSTSCRVEATDDDCGNRDHRVCGYEIQTPNVPFAIDSNGSISVTKTLTNEKYEFDVIAVDCQPLKDQIQRVSQPARVTFKVIKSCKPMITDKASTPLTIQSDRTNLFDTIKVNTCDETCEVEDIVGTVELDSHGLDSGCNLEQCSTISRQYALLSKEASKSRIPPTQASSFDGHGQAILVNKTEFSGHFNNEFVIRMWMKHANEEKSNDKQHIFCKSDEKLKNRHHTALFVQNNHLKLLLRKGPLTTSEKKTYASEWIWKLSQINDNQWHSYKFVVNYPTKIDLYIDEKLIVPTAENFQLVEDHPLATIDGTEDTVFALGACWHGRASRMVQHFHGQLSAVVIEQKEELQRSSDCIRDCQQYLDIVNVERESNMEFISNSNRSMWMLRTDAKDSYEKLLKNLVYRNTFAPIGPHGQRTISVRTRVKCLGESYTSEMPLFTRAISIEAPKIPTKIELKGDTNYIVPESVMNRGIYLFRNLSIYTNAIKKSQADISDCSLSTVPHLSHNEQLIVPELKNLEKLISQAGVIISGIDSIDSYQYALRQIAFISKSPVKYADRTFVLNCAGAHDQISTNEIRVRVNIEKQMAPPAPVAAILSNKLVVDNDGMRDDVFDANVEGKARNVSDWPVAVVICVSVGLAGVLVLYLVVRMRSNKRNHSPMNNTGDDLHSQMEWEDDIGLNITVNPLDETKKSGPSANLHSVDQALNGCSGVSSDDEYDGHNHNEYSSDEEEEEFAQDQVHPRKLDHQLEWDDAAIEYGPKKV